MPPQSSVTPERWAVTVLDRLGIRPSRGAVQAMVGWARAEGGHWNNSARYNPLNTTQPMPGAGNTGTQGNIKVYTNWQQGVDATVRTLKNGRYGGILHALQTGNPNAVANAIGQTPWGTSGGLVAQTIASTRVGGTPAPIGPAGATARRRGGPSTAAADVAPDGQGQQLAAMLLAQSLQSAEQPRPQSMGLQTPAFAAGPALPQGAMSVQSAGTQQDSPGAALSRALTAVQALGGTETAPDPASAADAPTAAPVRGKGKVKITGPNPGRIKPSVLSFARRISAILGEPIVGSDGTGHSYLTVNGNVSQHSTGNATDIPATGADLIRKGRAALIAAGMPRKKALAQTGGLFNVGTHQVIFNTHEGGDHTNHLHISAR